MRRERALRAVPDAAASLPPSPADRERALAADLAASARGDEQAFERVYDSVSGAVYGIALRMVRDRAMAEEVAQEALVEVWRSAPRYRPESGSARSWVLTIAHRRAVDKVRSEHAHARRVEAHGAATSQVPAAADAVVELLYGEWEAERVRAGLELLTARQREALELTFYKGYTHREAAESLGVPLGTAKARIRDALIRLRDTWEEER